MKKIRPYITIASAIAAILLVALGVIDYQKVVHLTDFTGGQNILAASVSFALLCIIFSAAVIKGRVQPKKVLSAASSRALWFVGIFAISILVGMLFSKISAKLVRNIALAALLVVVAAVILVFYIRGRRRMKDQVSASSVRRSASASGASKFSYAYFFGVMILLEMLTIAALLCSVSASVYMTVSVLASLTVILWRLFRWRGFLLLGSAAILIYSICFGIYRWGVVLTGYSVPVITIFCVIFMLLLPLVDFYNRKEENV